jgi:glucan 1,3-beta-glucosidase
MSRLKAYYTAASAAVRDASSGSVSVTVHDAFWGPAYWASSDLASSSALTPASYAIIDTHQYYAFPPYGNLPQDAMLGMICNMSQLLKNGVPGWNAQGQQVQTLPRTVVGEWSLESGSGHSAAASEKPSSQEKRTWLRKFFEAQVAAYVPNGQGQPGQGFYYWSCASFNPFTYTFGHNYPHAC